MTQLTVTVTVTDSGGHSSTSSAVCDVIDQAYRDALVPEVDMPNADRAGLLPGVALSAYNATTTPTVTFSTANQTITNKHVYGNVSITVAGVVFRNCHFHGRSDGVIPSSNAMVTTNSATVVGAKFYDCLIRPDVVISPGINGHVGHEAQFFRCEFQYCQDGAQWHDITKTMPYNTNNKLTQCWVHDMAWFTAATTGVVHPSDIETHNDCIQLFGGANQVIQGCRLDAYYARNTVGHWACVGDPHTEPYVQVPLHSLPDGGPYQPLPDRGNGNEASGRYNVGDLSAIMISGGAGWVQDTQILGNWINGGQFGINNGGDRPANQDVQAGNVLRNRFSRDQGIQGAGGNDTWTVNSDTSGWVGRWNVPTTGVDRNYYASDGGTIRVRIT